MGFSLRVNLFWEHDYAYRIIFYIFVKKRVMQWSSLVMKENQLHHQKVNIFLGGGEVITFLVKSLVPVFCNGEFVSYPPGSEGKKI